MINRVEKKINGQLEVCLCTPFLLEKGIYIE